MNKILDFFTDAAREGREAYLEGQPDREKQKELRRKIRAEKRAEKIRRLEEEDVYKRQHLDSAMLDKVNHALEISLELTC